MAKAKVRYFIEKDVASDRPRYYWQPSAALREQGWHAERLPDNRGSALARAERLNAELDTWRKGGVLPPGAKSGPDETPVIVPPVFAAPKSPLLVQPHSIAWLIREYCDSRYFTEKRPKTQKSYRENLRFIEKWAGDMPISSVDRPRIEKMYEAVRKKTPAKANAVVRMLRILLGYAVTMKYVATNPALNPGLIELPFSGKYWPIDAVSLMVEVADRMDLHSIGTAIILNHWIGQREMDILDMPRASWRAGRFKVFQQKTKARASIPQSPWVKARLEAEIQRQKARGIASSTHLLLCEATGLPWKQSTFQKRFADVRRAAADIWPTFDLGEDDTVDTADLWFMHLRHTAVTELARAGCSVPQIAAITGHTLKSVYDILKRYLVMTSGLADEATSKRMELGNELAALDEIFAND